MRAIRAARFGVVLLLLAAYVAVPGRVGAAAPTYSVVDVGSLVGTGDGQFDTLTSVIAVGVNDDGVAIANTGNNGASFWAIPFSTTNGKIKRLGKEKAFSIAQDINSE